MAMTLDEAVLAADDALHPFVRSGVGRDARLEALREELAWSVDVAATDRDFARDYRRRMPHDGAEDDDYLNRWVTVRDDLHVLLGPRHRARDRARPFVAVEAASRRIVADDLPALRAVSAAEFRVFAPKAVVLWDQALPEAWPGTTPDMRLLAGSAGRIRSRPVPADLVLTPAPDLDGYDRYLDASEELFAQHPEAREWTTPKDRAVLEACQAQGLLLEATVDGEWAGPIAGERAVHSGLRGVSVTEVLLRARFRGRGLGPGLTIGLARAAPIRDDEFVFGTVHRDNAAARASALAAGREDIGGEVVVALP